MCYKRQPVKKFFTATCLWLALLAGAHAAEFKPDSAALARLPSPAAGPVEFAKDIRPIFADNCYKCHGPEKHKNGLRLDSKTDALAGGDSGKAILPGKSTESRLIHYVAGLDPEKVMPPKGDRLTAEQIGRLRAWIDAGAAWPEEAGVAVVKTTDHWAFKAPVRTTPPKVKNTRWVRNPVDNFVLARLEKEKIKPSPEADRITLIRRLSLDLLGLPPTPEQVEAFARDPQPEAYEKLVDSLLASPHFGERWGRHWLDLARYADSDGYEKDLARPYAYLFRDWVIKAINEDMPFDEFTLEQLAGDLLPNATESQKVATGFHRQTLTNREGGTDKEEFRCKAVVDRVSTTGAAWLGLTVGCAECHSHKFDPITQREFYELFAFFNNASEKDIPAPQPLELAGYEAQLKTWEAKLAELAAPLNDYLKGELPDKLAAWEQTVTVPAARWSVLAPKKLYVSTEGDETQFAAQKDGSIVPRARDPVRSIFRLEVEPNLQGVTGFRLEAIAEDGKLVGRGKNGDFALGEFIVTAQTGDGSARRIEFATAKADFEEKNGEATRAIDGDRNTGWGASPQSNRTHVIVFETKEPQDLPKGTKLSIKVEHFIGGLMNRFRVSATTSALPLEPSTLPDSIVATLATPSEQRGEKPKAELARYFAEHVDAEGIQLNLAVVAHKAKKPKFPETAAAVLVADERKTHIHVRGDFLRKGDEVQPGTLGVLHPFKPRGAEADRLDFARWLVDPANPLTSRVTVNHVWKNLFGRALVTTVNDFGTRGDKPTHPELLDWLAVTFMSSASLQPAALNSPPGLGWSRKALIKLIVTSATYRQSSALRPELVARDPNNLWLARQNRYRLEAENVRDVWLAASGLLNPAIGGPSVRPPMPADLAALGYANTVKWAESTGAEKYRRGLYIFFQRTVPYPMLMTFDAPDTTVTCTRRDRSNTPLQALTLLNDPVFFECAQALGKRLAGELGPLDVKITNAFQLCLGRNPRKEEVARLRKFHDDMLAQVKTAPESAAKITGEMQSDTPSLVSPEEKAALVAVSRVLMNVDEFVTRE